MKYTIALSVFTILLPIYGQEKSAHPSSRATNQGELRQPATKTQPASPPTNGNVVNQQTSSPEVNGAKINGQGYLTRFLAPENLPNIGLFLAGIVGIYVAIKTLKAMERQTRVLVESQRPRIVATANGDPSKTLADPHARRVELEVVNKSSMPATDYRYESWIEVLSFPFEDFTAAADHFKSDAPSVLYPDTPQVINIPIRGGITPEDFIEVRRLRKHVCVRLYVEYADPFIANRRCYSNFGFHILPKGLGFLEKYNGVGYEDKKA